MQCVGNKKVKCVESTCCTWVDDDRCPNLDWLGNKKINRPDYVVVVATKAQIAAGEARVKAARVREEKDKCKK